MNFKKIRGVLFVLIYLAILWSAQFLPKSIFSDLLLKIGMEYLVVLIAFVLFFMNTSFHLSLRINSKVQNLKFIIPIVTLLCIYSGYSSGLFTGTLINKHPVLLVLSIAFVQTLSEELIFRGLFINELKTHLKMNTHKAVIVSSILFGLFHFLSLAKTSEVDSVINQVIIAGGLGYFLAAMFITSNNILIPAIAHFFINLPAYFKRIVVESNEVVAAQESTPFFEMIVSSTMIIILYSPLFIIGYLLITKVALKKQ